MALAWLPGRGTPPHDHGTWAIVVGVEGEERNRILSSRRRPQAPGLCGAREGVRARLPQGRCRADAAGRDPPRDERRQGCRSIAARLRTSHQPHGAPEADVRRGPRRPGRRPSRCISAAASAATAHRPVSTFPRSSVARCPATDASITPANWATRNSLLTFCPGPRFDCRASCCRTPSDGR